MDNMKRLAALLALMALLAMGCAPVVKTNVSAVAAAPLGEGNAPELEKLIRRQCEPFMAQAKSVGLAVAVVSPAESTVVTFGHPSVSTTQPVRANTLYEIGSITKTLTAIALARQVERGTMRL